MSGPSKRDPGVTGRSSPGQYANAVLRERLRTTRRRGAGASLACAASATNLHLANHRDASACGQRVSKHARYTFI